MIKLSNIYHSYSVREEEDALIDKLRYFFKPHYTKIEALKNINLTINKGELIGYIGPNGSGKSTTIKLLTGLMKPIEGKVTVLGVDPFKNRIQLAKKTGILMGQKSLLWWDLPVEDSFKILKKIYRVPEKEYENRLNELLDMLEIKEYLKRPVRQLSLGQRMRAELVAVFIHNPELVYLDEPTLGLDIYSKQKVMDFLLKINKREHTTIILTTHDLSDVEKVCEKIFLINQGELAFSGKIVDFLSKYSNLKSVILESELKLDSPTLPSSFSLIENRINSWQFIYDATKLSELQVLEIIENLPHKYNASFSDINLESILKGKVIERND